MLTVEATKVRAALPYLGNSCLKVRKRSVTAREMTAQEFKNLRMALGISQRQMAKILGVSHMSIVRAEGSRGPTRALESYLQLALSKGQLKIAEKKSKRDRRPDK